jgi:hypothetical protein
LEVGSEVIACFGYWDVGQEGGGIFSLVIEDDFIICVGSEFEVDGCFGAGGVIRRLTIGTSWLNVGVDDENFVFEDVEGGNTHSQ